MNESLIKHVWLKTRSELPGRLEIDTFYHIADEGVMVIDHGVGPVEFGAQKAVNTLEGNETDKAPSVRAVNEGLRNIPGVAGLDRGVFATPEALSAAHTTDIPGAYARVQSTDTVWSWNGTAWADTLMPISSLVTEVVDNLTSDAAQKALSAKQGKALKGEIDGLVVNNLTTNAPDKALSASMGKALAENKFDASSAGALTLLDTEDKTTLVNAINEVLGNIGGLSDLDTTEKGDMVVAINEIVADLNALTNAIISGTVTASLWTQDGNEGIETDSGVSIAAVRNIIL